MPSWILSDFQVLNLPQEPLFMIGTDSMRGDFHVKEADFTNQRLLPFVFTPGANDFHNA